MAVQAYGEGLRQLVVVAVEVSPPRLDEADGWISLHQGDGLVEEGGLGEEISVEEGDVLALGGLQGVLERASLEPVPGRPPYHTYVQA